MAASALARLLSRLRGRRGAAAEPAVERAHESGPRPEWEYVPEGWARLDADARIKGWNVEAIAAAHRATWPSYAKAVEGPGPLGIYHEVPVGEPVQRDVPIQQNVIMSYAYVLALAARRKERISILDWGGGIGHYYLLSKALLPGVEIDYHIKDVPALCSEGAALFPDVHFCDDESCLRLGYDLVLASNSLQFSPAWEETLARLAAATRGHLFVTRIPVSVEGASFVVLQRAYGYGYDTEFLGWVFGRDELLDVAAGAGMDFMREFVFHSWSIPGAPHDPIELRGYLFAPY